MEPTDMYEDPQLMEPTIIYLFIMHLFIYYLCIYLSIHLFMHLFVNKICNFKYLPEFQILQFHYKIKNM